MSDADSSRPRATVSTGAPSSLTVLVVDDDADMRIYLRGCLRSLNLTDVVEAADGLEALHLARAVRVNLIISDIVMPGLDGVALCRALKADTALASIPVLLISGEASELPPDVGADAFLAKPFNTEDLRACLQPLLGRSP